MLANVGEPFWEVRTPMGPLYVPVTTNCILDLSCDYEALTEIGHIKLSEDRCQSLVGDSPMNGRELEVAAGG